MMHIDLAGKVALVTGGGQGLGAATCRMLANAGAAVAINYYPDPAGQNRERAEALAAELGDRALAVAADVRDAGAVNDMITRTREKFGRLDIVVNNAGIINDRTLKKMTHEEWQRVIDTNLTGVFNVCKAAVEVLEEGGRIVNLASIAAVVGFFGQANYAAAKAGVVGLTKVLSRELGRKAITVNAVAPGVVLTDMGKTIPESVREEMLKNVPLNRFGEPDEIAGVILFLCSPLAGYVSGQLIHVNGGWIG